MLFDGTNESSQCRKNNEYDSKVEGTCLQYRISVYDLPTDTYIFQTRVELGRAIRYW